MQGLIFDFDGLILDTETLTANIAMEMVNERGGKSRLSDWAPLFGPTGREAAWAQTIAELLGPDVDVAEFHAVLNERRRPFVDDLQPMPGVIDLMGAAREREWKIGLATGHLGTPLMDTLARLELVDYFDAIVQTHDVPRPKPAPDIFLETARRLELDPNECLVLEDSLAGYEAASSAGMTVIVCPCEVTRFATFPNEARLIHSLTDLDLDAFH